MPYNLGKHIALDICGFDVYLLGLMLGENIRKMW